MAKTCTSELLLELARFYNTSGPWPDRKAVHAEWELRCKTHPSLRADDIVALMHEPHDEARDWAKALRALAYLYANREVAAGAGRWIDPPHRLLDILLERLGLMAKLARPAPPVFGAADLELARAWTRDAGADPHELNKMLSARQAELAALAIYRELYGAAVDRSVEQLGADVTVWPIADIESAGRLIDIKNARASGAATRAGVRSYSELCVPEHKRDLDGRDVILAGFYSDYHRYDSCEYPIPPSIWLGECSRESIASLRTEFEGPSLKISLRRYGKASVAFLPPWIFEYPPKCYDFRRVIIGELRKSKPLGGCPLYLGILADWPADRANAEYEALRTRFRGPLPVNRSRLFLHVLDRFLAAVRESTQFDHAALREAIFPDVMVHHVKREASPLLLHDPLQSIWALINTLERAASTCRQAAKHYTSFKLQGPNILKGVLLDGHEETILAYCGDCGKNPIHLGDESLCPCGNGRLRCANCGYCSMACPIPR